MQLIEETGAPSPRTGLTGAPPPSCSSRPPLLSSAWSRLLFTAVTPLVASANTNGQLRAHEADPLLPDSYAAARLAGRFATVIAWRTWPAPSCAACKTSCLLRTLAYIYTLPVLWQVRRPWHAALMAMSAWMHSDGHRCCSSCSAGH